MDEARSPRSSRRNGVRSLPNYHILVLSPPQRNKPANPSRSNLVYRPKKWTIEDARRLIQSPLEDAAPSKSVFMWKNGKRRKSRMAGVRTWQAFRLLTKIEKAEVYASLRSVVVEEHWRLEKQMLQEERVGKLIKRSLVAPNPSSSMSVSHSKKVEGFSERSQTMGRRMSV
jgi:hypothetical protein